MTDANRARNDRTDVAELILRERLARDNFEWDKMAACYHPDSVVDLSWFYGSGAEFVARSRDNSKAPLNFHQISYPVADVRGDRAIAEVPCGLRSFSKINGIDVSYEGFVHLFWRAAREGERWLLMGLRVVYKVDMFHAREPGKTPVFDEQELAGYRQSYRYMMVNLQSAGLKVRDDLNGFDRPETVRALRDGQEAWLAGA